MSLLQIENLESGYGKTSILFDINIEIGEGEIVAMIGPNGAGKTTLLRTISGLLSLKKGKIYFHDKRLDNFRPDERAQNGIGFVPQDNNVFSTLTVMENLEMGAYLLSRFENRFDEIFDLFPRLQERKTQKAGTLSGGERQMLAIASSLILSPELLMLDEPCGGLAPLVAEEVCSKIISIHQMGTVIFWVIERELESMLKMAARCYVMESGHVSFEGTSEDLMADKKYHELILKK